jgi:threonine synthase
MDVTATFIVSGWHDEMCAITVTFRYATTLVDPHTAVAIAAAENWVTNCKTLQNDPQLPLWQPNLCKFQESVTVAIGEDAWAE